MIKEFPPQAPPELTDREKEILLYIATGTSNKEIANILSISANTVKVHLRNIFTKIGVTSRTEAAMYAVRAGMVSGTEIGSAATSQEAVKPAGLSRGWIITISIVAVVWVTAMIIYLANRPAPLPVVTALPTTASGASRWTTLTDMPDARSGMAATAYENMIYTIGGENSSGITGAVQIYDTQKDAWSEAAPKPLAVTDINAVVIGGKIYVPGGRTQGGMMSKALEVYDPRLDKWEKGADLPLGLCGYGLATLEGRLYLFGGLNDEQKALNSVYIYNPDQNEWTEGSPMPTRRAYAGAAAAADKIYVMGGFDGKKALAVNEIYSPHLEGEDDAWQSAGLIPAKIYAMGITSIADTIYLMGGKDGEEREDVPLVYFPQINTWQAFEMPPGDSVSEVKLVPAGEYIYVLGRNNQTKGYTLRYQAIYLTTIPFIP